MTATFPREQTAKLHFRDGLRWLGESWNLLMGRPGLWILFGLVTIVITSLVSFVPVLGFVAGFVLSPIFGASYVLTATLQENGRETRISNAFLGFQHRTDQLVLVGVFQLLLFIGAFVIPFLFTAFVGLVAFLMDRAAFRAELQSMIGMMETEMSGAGSGMMSSPESMKLLLVLGFLAFAIWLVAAAVVTMMGWFSPALVTLREMDAWPAMKASLRACMTEIMPLLGFSLGLLGVGTLVVLTLGVGLLVAIPWVQLSIYSAFKALFPAGARANLMPEAAITPAP